MTDPLGGSPDYCTTRRERDYERGRADTTPQHRCVHGRSFRPRAGNAGDCRLNGGVCAGRVKGFDNVVAERE